MMQGDLMRARMGSVIMKKEREAPDDGKDGQRQFPPVSRKKPGSPQPFNRPDGQEFPGQFIIENGIENRLDGQVRKVPADLPANQGL